MSLGNTGEAQMNVPSGRSRESECWALLSGNTIIGVHSSPVTLALQSDYKWQDIFWDFSFWTCHDLPHRLLDPQMICPWLQRNIKIKSPRIWGNLICFFCGFVESICFKALRSSKDSSYLKGLFTLLSCKWINTYVPQVLSSLLQLPVVVQHFNDEGLAAYVFHMDVE